MDSLNFCYFLQGLLEVGKPAVLNEEQVILIRKHLQLVFENKTANMVLDSSKPIENEGWCSISFSSEQLEDLKPKTLPVVVLNPQFPVGPSC